MLRQKPSCSLSPAIESLNHTLSDVSHSVCEASAKCNFPVCANAPSYWLSPLSSWLPLVRALLMEIRLLGFATWQWLHFSVGWKPSLGFFAKNFLNAP